MKRIAVRIAVIAAMVASLAAVNWSSAVKPAAPKSIAANWGSGTESTPTPAGVNWSR